MKLICLNIWGGIKHDEVLEFIKQKSLDTDIFCFQEIFKSDKEIIISKGAYSNIKKEVEEALPGFRGYFYPTSNNGDLGGYVDFPLYFGQETFIKNDIKVLDLGNVFIHKKLNEFSLYPNGRPNFPRNFIYTVLEKNGKKFLVLNVHGFWEPAAKVDNPNRFRQSQIILDFIEKYDIPKVVAGDLNLRITTKALLMFDEKLRNLVKEYKVKTTRSNLYDAKWRVERDDKYADYIFVSRDAIIKDFKVLQDQVSDHLPLYLEFEV
ncbi:MAG: endonuclease/exonuclease/phosphatase family protein [Candidatus Levybacteria bacterium]|nr:endonuclease/exonuclease/phosphatase family protein [Candidatus Levybacteria bacterium]